MSKLRETTIEVAVCGAVVSLLMAAVSAYTWMIATVAYGLFQMLESH